jgi:hypothetical protein
MARRALQNVPVPARRSIDVTVLIDWQDYINGGIARYADGTTIAPDRVRRLLCDAELNVIITGERRTVMDVPQSPQCHPATMAGTHR